MTTHHLPVPAVPAVSDAERAGFETSRTDLVLTGRATLTAEYLRGLIVAGQLAAAGTPRKLPQEVFPEEDPVVVQEVFDRGVAVGFHMARFARNPYLYRDQLERLRRELGEAAYAAMAGALGPVLATAVPAHPADGESDRGH